MSLKEREGESEVESTEYRDQLWCGPETPGSLGQPSFIQYSTVNRVTVQHRSETHGTLRLRQPSPCEVNRQHISGQIKL